MFQKNPNKNKVNTDAFRYISFESSSNVNVTTVKTPAVNFALNVWVDPIKPNRKYIITRSNTL